MAKKAIYYDEAKRLYVTQGITSLATIEDMLGGNVSRRQLHNWRDEGQWDEKRKRYLEENESLQDMVMDIAKTAARNAKTAPTPKNMLALIRALSALNQKDAMAMLAGDDQKDEEKSNEDIKKLVTESIKDIMGA